MSETVTTTTTVERDGELEDWEAEEELADASITIGLGKTGERGSGYHVRNDPAQPLQRQTVVEQRGLIEARCQSLEIVHGVLSPESNEWATLLVYQINLDTTKRSRRIVSATVSFEFSSSTPRARAPRIHEFSPSRRIALLATTQDQTVTRGLEAGVDSSAATIVGAGLSAKWVKSVSKTVTDEARVTGSTLSDGFGRNVGASWVLSENKSIKSGVPSQLRCAMLLARDDNGPFQCKVTINAEADWKSKLTNLFGTSPTDDPVLFDPTIKPTNRLRKTGYNLDNLGEIDLEELSEIRF
ncbi:hypothetical protein QBC34DRAFT_411877 [Podospora aff. communis PSN243]|uniref:Uncharacterized protein n=1 Tax=Podospora aff. communis PSN243 TaxID=3040156 RepID=A0AAV9GCU6_9PEZI|nr:hypothetical protein QBC34DRAFT_411877 [Podospora aff. communis PSN243]